MLPKFLIADNSQEVPEKIFVVHTEVPRFIIEGDIEDIESDMLVHWIDDEAAFSDQLIAEALNFYEDELASQEELFDEEA